MKYQRTCMSLISYLKIRLTMNEIKNIIQNIGNIPWTLKYLKYYIYSDKMKVTDFTACDNKSYQMMD
jgi:hypothetical protein